MINKDLIEFNRTYIPIKIIYHKRNTITGKLKNRGAILSLPSFLGHKEIEQRLQAFKQYLLKELEKQPELIQQYKQKNYKSGDLLRVGKRSYQIQIEQTDGAQHAAKLVKERIHLKILKSEHPYYQNEAIKTLLSRIIGKDFLPEITRRVRELNEIHFNQPINQVRLKYNHSNWGSCSTKGNINLSTRLLFAPDSVIDYVIIHELAHRLEANHSPAFWSLVAKAMPDYKKKEQWLKENQTQCDF